MLKSKNESNSFKNSNFEITETKSVKKTNKQTKRGVENVFSIYHIISSIVMIY